MRLKGALCSGTETRRANWERPVLPQQVSRTFQPKLTRDEGRKEGRKEGKGEGRDERRKKGKEVKKE